jgi:putative ABC transport system permease protein
MLTNYFKIALRNLRRNGVFSAINIFGLAVGLAACLLIAAYVRDETHYDRFASRSRDIYRVDLGVTGNVTAHYPMVDAAVGPGMAANYPDVEAFTRMERMGDNFVHYGVQEYKERKMVAVDSNFFEIFSIPFLEGDVHTALEQPNSLVITSAFAKKYFGDASAMGKTISLTYYGDCKVTGIIDKIPDESHFHFDAFLSWRSLNWLKNPTWTNVGYYTYLVLREDASATKLQAQFPGLVAKYCVPEIARDMGVPLAEAKQAVNTFVFTLTPLTDIHLHSDTKYELEANGNSRYVLIFAALAVFILLLACANFTNLSTAGAASRAREIGIRKVMGSLRRQLIVQFLVESILLTGFAMVLAFLLVLTVLPYFNALSGKHIVFSTFLGYPALIAALMLTVLVGAAAGIYPAFFLSAFNTIKVLKSAGGAFQGGRRSLVRAGLVVFQFFISIVLIIATMIVYRQLHFMQDKRLGYDKEQVVYIDDTRLLGTREEAFRQLLLEDKRAVRATLSENAPGSGDMNGTEVFPKETGPGNGREMHIDIFNIDYDYVPTLGLEVVKGRNFTRGFSTDSAGVLINETAVDDLGWGHTNPIGKIIGRSGTRFYTVVGVVRDFHYLSVKQKIGPLMMMLGNNHGGILVKVNGSDMAGFLGSAKKDWAAFSAGGPFSYYFLDDKFASLYESEQRTGSVFTSFTIIALLIAGLGLFGLAAYMVEQRTREIGIRKVLGASVSSVLLLVSREFMVMVGLAFLIAVPFSWWGMNQWLREFAYRVPMSWWLFPLAGLVASSIAVITVSFQARRAATANPIESLRSD